MPGGPRENFKLLLLIKIKFYTRKNDIFKFFKKQDLEKLLLTKDIVYRGIFSVNISA